MYEPIWVRLKQDYRNSKHSVSVTAVRALHPRILKAVKKEKHLDVAFKIQIEPYHAVLSHSVNGNILTFRLSLKKALTVEDL
jgi:hypothetical protein